MFLRINFILIFSFLLFNNLKAEIVKIFTFTEQEFLKMKVNKVRGADSKTKYSLGRNENGNYIKSVAENSASAIGKEIKINLSNTPYINITWIIE